MINQLIRHFRDHKSQVQRLAKEGGWIFAGQVASVIGSLVLVRVLTEYLDPAEYGQLALGMTIAGLVNQVVMGGINNGIGRFYSIATEKGDLWGYLRAARHLLLVATMAVMALTVILMGGLIAMELRQWLWLALAALMFSILSGYNSVLNGIQNAARQRSVVALHGGMDSWLRIGLAVGAMLWFGTSSAAVVIGYTLSALLVTLSQLFFLKRLIVAQGAAHYNKTNENWARQIWAFSWPFSTWGVFTWAQQVSDRWALESFATTSDVGHYVVLFQLGYAPIGMLTGLMMSLIGPILFQKSGDAKDSIRNSIVDNVVWSITKISLALTSVSFAVTFIFHDFIFRYLVAESFREISFLLPWVVLAGGLFATGQMLSLKMISELRSRSLLLLKVNTALLGVSANISGALWFGVQGVVGALILFSVVYCTCVFIISNKK